MEITLVRHGEPEWVRDGLSIDDPPLTDLGVRQAELLAERLTGEHFDEVFVSPLLRARQTAAPVLATLGLDEWIQPWLHEINNGIWQGNPAEKADEAFRVARAKPVDEHWDGLPGGEPVRDFQARVRGGAEQFLAERGIVGIDHDLPVWKVDGSAQRILLIAHAGTNSVLVSYLLGLQPVPWEWDRFVLSHTSVTTIEALPIGGGHTFSLTSLGSVEHLPAHLRTR